VRGATEGAREAAGRWPGRGHASSRDHPRVPTTSTRTVDGARGDRRCARRRRGRSRAQYAIAYYGILLSGATFSPTNPLLPPADLAAQLADCGAVVAVSWTPVTPALRGVRHQTSVRLILSTDREQALDPGHRRELESVSWLEDFEAFHADAPTTPPAIEIDIHRDLAHLAYTGGTTGRSKGVPLPHRNVVVNALQYACRGSGSVPRSTTRAAWCSTRSARPRRTRSGSAPGSASTSRRGSTRWARSAR
jgi:acyl-CoA synthetase (AMP-forming)/AMP-acid ligase II